MIPLYERYNYHDHEIIVPSEQALDSVIPREGEVRFSEIHDTGITLTDGTPVHYECIVNNYSNKVEGGWDGFGHILLTACIRDRFKAHPIGFRDLFLYPNRELAVGGECFGNCGRERFPTFFNFRNIIPRIIRGVPRREIRLNNAVNLQRYSFLVLDDKRFRDGVKLGRAIFFTSLELAGRLGIKKHMIEKRSDKTVDDATKSSWYGQFVEIGPESGDIVFSLE